MDFYGIKEALTTTCFYNYSLVCVYDIIISVDY